MYALYVKNKPVSDRLLAENGKFFQTKQAELGDKMDLASYLLKPVQRLGKYSLFLDGISRTNGPKSELVKARTIIQFQVSDFFLKCRVLAEITLFQKRNKMVSRLKPKP